MARKITLGAGRRYGATLFASAARTATPTPAVMTVDGESLEVVIDVTAIAATPSVVFNIERRDDASGKWILLLASAALAAVATTRLRVTPHLAAVANQIATDIGGGVIRVRPVHGDADSITYTVGAVAF